MKFLTALVLALSAVLVYAGPNVDVGGGHGNGGQGQPAGQGDPRRAMVMPIAKAAFGFAADVYTEIASSLPNDTNIIFAPRSIGEALGLILMGAQGNTRQQIKEAMGVANITDGRQRVQVMHQLLTRSDGNYHINLANRIYMKRGPLLLNSFINKARMRDLMPETIDFVPAEQACETINDWVETQTQGKIEDLMKPSMFNVDTRFVLVNAIYFKAPWEHVFDSALTRNGVFHSPSGDITTPMMKVTGSFSYAEMDGLKFVSLPYINGNMSMVFFLPDNMDNLELTLDLMMRLRRQARRQTVDVTIPKFKITQEVNLKQVLQALGVTDLFERGVCDLSGMDGTHEIFVSDAVHKAFIEVNEQGSEAAGATGVSIQTMSAVIAQAEFKADRPFMFAIYDRLPRMTVFMGRVSRPQTDVDDDGDDVDDHGEADDNDSVDDNDNDNDNDGDADGDDD